MKKLRPLSILFISVMALSLFNALRPERIIPLADETSPELRAEQLTQMAFSIKDQNL